MRGCNLLFSGNSTQYALMFKFLGILLLVVSVSYGQPKRASGTITDDLGIPLNNVTIINTSNNLTIQSDCWGYYEIKALKKDTLVFRKEGYLKSVKKISRYKRNSIIIGFDYESYISKLERNTNIDSSVRNGGQPLFFLDRKPIEKPMDPIDFKKGDVKTVKVFKGAQAIEKYGTIFTKNGVVLIFTNCNYKLRIRQ